MIDKNKPFMDVFGTSGVAYQQGKKLYNRLGLEVEISEDGLSADVIEDTPEGVELEPIKPEREPEKDDGAPLTWDSHLTIHERVRITDENSPDYLDADEIKTELEKRNVNYDKRMHRPKLIMILKHELGA